MIDIAQLEYEMSKFKKEPTQYIRSKRHREDVELLIDLLKYSNYETKLKEFIAENGNANIYTIFEAGRHIDDKLELIKLMYIDHSYGIPDIGDYYKDYYTTNKNIELRTHLKLVGMTISRMIELYDPSQRFDSSFTIQSLRHVLSDIELHKTEFDKEELSSLLTIYYCMDAAYLSSTTPFNHDDMKLVSSIIDKIAEYLYGPSWQTLVDIARQLDVSKTHEYWRKSLNTQVCTPDVPLEITY